MHYLGVICKFWNNSNEEQKISGCLIDGAISVRVDGGFGSYRWFVKHNNAIGVRCILDTNIALWATQTASAPSILLVLLEPH